MTEDWVVCMTTEYPGEVTVSMYETGPIVADRKSLHLTLTVSQMVAFQELLSHQLGYHLRLLTP